MSAISPSTIGYVDNTLTLPNTQLVDTDHPLPVILVSEVGDANVNVAEVGGNPTSTGNGAADSGTQRVTLASDSIGTVSPSAATVTATMTRPNDTAPYASGDVFSSSTSAGTNLTFTNMARQNGGAGIILGATISDSANQTIKGIFQLWLWAVAPGATNDNTAMALTDTESNNVVAVIDIDGVNIGNAGSGATGNVRFSATNPVREFVCDTGSTSLFGQIRVNNVYTPVASEVLSVNLLTTWR